MPARKPLLTADAAAFVKGAEPPAAAPAMEPEARVRFTVDLPRSLHRRLKQAALDRDQPMTDLARQALAKWIEGQA